jgi:hypothetical protein
MEQIALDERSSDTYRSRSDRRHTHRCARTRGVVRQRWRRGRGHTLCVDTERLRCRLCRSPAGASPALAQLQTQGFDESHPTPASHDQCYEERCKRPEMKSLKFYALSTVRTEAVARYKHGSNRRTCAARRTDAPHLSPRRHAHSHRAPSRDH